jgi:hypothetical protein
MLEQLMQEVSGMWNWMLSQLGWGGELGWFKIAVLVLAFFGAIFLLRRLFGGSSVGGGGGSTVIYPPERQRGFPTSFYVGGRRLGDFSVPKNVYDFKVPTSTPDLSNLRKPASLDLERAKKLFIPPIPSNPGRDPKTAFSRRDEDNRGTRSRRPEVKLDWDLAGKLFIPNFPGKNGGLRKR